MRLSGKVALVTGGGRSIGRAIALAFAREGADVAVNYVRDDRAADETAAAVQQAGRRSMTVRADTSAPADVASMVEAVLTRFGVIDVL